MPSFEPYHKFQSAERLEKLVVKLHQGGNIATPVFQGHQRYHSALIYKLQCAQHHVDRLETKLNSTGIQEAATGTADFMFAINMSIDGFFYAGGSALDILAREIIIYYGQALPQKVYYSTARSVIGKSHPANPILSCLTDPTWMGLFREYRNVLTHELILAGNYSINVYQDGTHTAHSIVFPLPDDPRLDPANRSFKKNADLLIYLKDHLRRLLSCINIIYKEVINQAETQGSLPL